jgi:hypothetical protein
MHLNNVEQKLIPVTAKIIHSTVNICNRFVLRDGHLLHTIKLVGAVRNHHENINLEEWLLPSSPTQINLSVCLSACLPVCRFVMYKLRSSEMSKYTHFYLTALLHVGISTFVCFWHKSTKRTPQPWWPLSPWGRHGTLPPTLRRSNISQRAMQQGYIVKTKEIIINNTSKPIFCDNGNSIHVKQHTEH